MKAVRRLALRDLKFNKVRAVFATILISLPIMAILILGPLVSVAQTNWMFYGTEDIDDVQAAGYAACNCEIRQTPDGAVSYPEEPVDGDTDVDAAELFTGIISPNNTVEFLETPIYIDVQRTPLHNPVHVAAQPASPNEGLLIEGRLPDSDAEIVISSGTKEVLGVEVGDTIIHSRMGTDYEDVQIVGLTERTDLIYSEGSSAPELRDLILTATGSSQFVITGPDPVTWEQVKEFNRYGIEVASTAVIDDPPSDAEVEEWFGESVPAVDHGSTDMVLTVTIVILAIIEVVLLISPPFTMAVKRNERALGQIAALGATKKHLRSLMLYQGLFLGLAGALLGIAGFFVFRFVIASLTGESIPIIVWQYPAAVAVAVLLGLVAALLPAITASRIDVVAVLTGRESGKSVRGRKYIAGPVILVLGLVILLFTDGHADVLLAIGLIAAVLGLIFTAPLFVTMASAVIGKFSLAGKLAGRDAVRNVQRTAPGVAAMVVVTVISTFAISQLSTMMSTEYAEENRIGPRGSVWMELWHSGAGGDDEARLEQAMAEVDSIRPVKSWTPVYQAGGDFHYADLVTPPERRCPTEEAGLSEGLSEAEIQQVWDSIEDDERCAYYEDDSPWLSTVPSYFQGGGSIVDDGTFLDYLPDVENRELSKKVLSNGGMLVKHDRFVYNGEVTVNAVQIFPYEPIEPDKPPAVETSAALPGEAYLGTPAPFFILSPQAAEELGLDIYPTAALVEFEDPVTILESGNLGGDFVEVDGLYVSIVNEIHTSYVWTALVTALITLIVAGGTAVIIVVLSGRETRSDFDTIDAIGGKPGLRKRVSVAMAGVLTTAGIVPGLIIGIILTYPLGDLIGQGGLNPPILILIGLGAIIIAVSCLVAGLFAPRRKTLTRRLD